MDFPALVQRIIHPHTHTLEEAWKAAANSGYAAAILALNRVLFGTVWVSSPQPVGPGLAHLGVGLVYIILARIAFRRSRLASGVILVMAVLEVLIEVMLKAEFGFSFVPVAVALVLAFGGYRGAKKIYSRHRKSRS